MVACWVDWALTRSEKSPAPSVRPSAASQLALQVSALLEGMGMGGVIGLPLQEDGEGC